MDTGKNLRTDVCTEEVSYMDSNMINLIINGYNTTSNIVEVVYGYEPLCGWCYGFSNDLKKAINALETKVSFKLINGGIFAGNRGLKMGHISQHIKKNMGNVTNSTKVEFGEKFIELLEQDNYPYDSKKASIAVAIIREMKPQMTFDFAEAVQKAFFYYGQDLQSDDTYLNLIYKYNIDEKIFLQKLNSDSYSQKIEDEFLEAEKLNFSGYPASVINANSKTYELSQGYMTSEKFISKITQIIQQVSHTNLE